MVGSIVSENSSAPPRKPLCRLDKLERCRRFMYLKAYNMKSDDECTLSEYINSFTNENVGLSSDDVKGMLRTKSPMVNQVVSKPMYIDQIAEFIVSGKVDQTREKRKKKRFLDHNQMSPVHEEADSRERNATELKTKKSSALNPGQVDKTEDKMTETISSTKGEDDTCSIVLRRSFDLTTPGGRTKSTLSNKAVWRKREVVLQERIVEYTTMDAEGNVQELVETERSSNEVLHMECNDTGEFAHREAADFERSETFNKELVAHNHGNQEYVHLKSLEDEVEYMDSNNMPQAQQAGPEEGDDGDQGENCQQPPADNIQDQPQGPHFFEEGHVPDDATHRKSPDGTSAEQPLPQHFCSDDMPQDLPPPRTPGRTSPLRQSTASSSAAAAVPGSPPMPHATDEGDAAQVWINTSSDDIDPLLGKQGEAEVASSPSKEKTPRKLPIFLQ